MTVFVAASDETGGADQHSSVFLHGGFVAPADSWRSWFTPAWEERVLERRQRLAGLPFLHMTSIRSTEWRRQHDLTDSEAERRVDEALRVINSMGCLHPITSQVDEGHFRSAFASISLTRTRSSPVAMEPTHLTFLMFAHYVLGCINEMYSDAEKVDFIVETSTPAIDAGFREFHELMPDIMQERLPALARLVGKLTIAGKDSVPLQAADVLCWHARRHQQGSLSPTDARRFRTLGRLIGFPHKWTAAEITGFAERAARAHPTSVASVRD